MRYEMKYKPQYCDKAKVYNIVSYCGTMKLSECTKSSFKAERLAQFANLHDMRARKALLNKAYAFETLEEIKDNGGLDSKKKAFELPNDELERALSMIDGYANMTSMLNGLAVVHGVSNETVRGHYKQQFPEFWNKNIIYGSNL